MATIDKENLQGDTPNTVDQPEISEKEASQTTETAKELAEETDATAATAAAAVAATVDSTVTAPEPEKIQEADGAAEDSKRKTVDPPTTASAAQRPVKRARTAYFIFADDRRAAIQAKHPGEGVAVVARELGKIWGSISTEEKEAYQKEASEERARVARELEAWKAAGGVVELFTQKSDGGLILPVARIRKICRLDPEVRSLSKEALLLVTKAAELMTAKLAGETVRVAQIQNRRKLLPDDIAQVCGTREQFLFLREDIQDLAREAKVAAAATSSNKASKSKAMDTDAEPAGKLLTAYFAVNPK